MQNTVDKFRSCTSHKQSFCVANIMKTGYIYVYQACLYIGLKPRDTPLSCFHMIVVQYHILLNKTSRL